MTGPPATREATRKRSRNLSPSSASLPSAKLAEPPSDRDRTSVTDRAAGHITESPRTVKEDADGDDMSGENKDTVEGTLEEREEAETVEEYKDTTPNLHEIKQEPESVAPGVTTASPKAPITADDPPATQSLFEPKDDTNEGSEFVSVEDEAVKAAWKKFVEKLDELAADLLTSQQEILERAIDKVVQAEREYRQPLIQAADIAAREEGRREGFERGYAAGLEQGRKEGIEQGKSDSYV